MSKRERKLAKKKRAKAKKVRRNKFASKLAKSLPKSEVWFWDLWKPYMSCDDLSNEVFCSYIPDVINKKHKYIIEIDGSIHDLERIQRKDAKKERIYRGAGYKVFRIKAYNVTQLHEVGKQVLELRGGHSKVTYPGEREIKQLYS